jgi:hypothetical protein
MRLIYVDESRDERLYVFSALMISDRCWQGAFRAIRQFRADLRTSDGIPVQTEFHAYRFVAGRGDVAPGGVVTKSRRCAIYFDALRLLASLPGVELVNVVAPKGAEDEAISALLEAVNAVLRARDDYGMLICDAGKEDVYNRSLRKRRVYNPVTEGFENCDLTTDERIIEDPIHKDSQHSYFVQAADFCAYALLRREHPLPSKMRYDLHLAFGELLPILARDATPDDPEGIRRL